MLNRNAERKIVSSPIRDDVFTHDEIDKLVSIPRFIKEDASFSHNINFFIKRPGGYYILLLILMSHL